MSSAQELRHWMRFKDDFVGVFASDEIHKVPSHTPRCFIVNTHASSLPGQHWVCVSVKGDRAYYFDPLALQPPLRSVIASLSSLSIARSRKAVQSPTALTCGHHCVYFLYHNQPAVNDRHAVGFINKYLT